MSPYLICSVNSRMSFRTLTLKTSPLCTLTVYCSPTQTHSNVWAWCATSRSIWIPRLTQNFAHSRQARSESKKSLFRNITLLTGYMRTYGFSRHKLYLLVCMWVRFGPLLPYNKAKRWTFPCRNGCFEKDNRGGQRHHAFMVCYARV